MSCKECGPLLSDLIDGALTADDRWRVESHLASCAPCAAELSALRAALEAFGEARGEEPPADLAARICLRLAAVPLAQPVPGGARPARRPHVGLAAAAMLLISVACVAFAVGQRRGRGASDALVAQLEDQAGRASTLEESVARLERARATERATWTDEMERLEREHAEERRLAEARHADAAAGARKEAGRQATELAAALARVDELEAGLESLATETRALRERAAELESCEAALAAATADGTQPSPGPTPAPSPRAPPGAPMTAADPVRAEPADAVTVRIAGGAPQLAMRGPRDQVIPELLKLARDTSRPEVARLAVATLEHLLDVNGADSTEAATETGLLADLGRIADRIGLGVPGRDVDAPERPAIQRSGRIQRLEARWRTESLAP